MILTQGLHRALQQHGSRPATVFQGRRRSVTDLVERVARLAGALQAHGVRAGDRVAMLAANSDRYAEFFAAAWWTGAVAVPLNTRWSGPEVVHALNDCGVCLLVLDDAHAARAAELRAGAPGVATLGTRIESRLSRVIKGVPGARPIRAACSRPTAGGSAHTGRGWPAARPAQRTRSASVISSGPVHS